jgi:phosphoribosyl-ATP pyrophosphohydrolase
MRTDAAWRFECETRHVLALRRLNRSRSEAYLAKVSDRRGAEAAKQLREAAAEMWKAEQQRREER